MAIAVEKLCGTNSSKAKHLLIIADGFVDDPAGAGRSALDAACAQVVAAIKASPWYARISDRLCVWVARSYMTGQHKTQLRFAPPCVAMPDVPTPTTRFEATYSQIAGDCRNLEGNPTKVTKFVNKLLDDDPSLPAFERRLVLVNYPRYGGQGRSTTAWASAGHQDLGDLALHEIGHLFGLHDEYESTCGVVDPVLTAAQAAEIVESTNICTDPLNGTVPPWQDPSASTLPRVEKATATPADCGSPGAPQPVSPAVFQGAYRTHLKYFRSELACKMRHPADPYCTLCSDVIAWMLDGSNTMPLY